MCDCIFIALYSYSLESLPLRSLTYEKLKSLSLIDKCQNIHILALNLHFVNFLVLLFFAILFHFCVFYVSVGHGRKESVYEKVPRLKGKLGRPRRYG
jgi:hypothetical protein